MSDDRRIRLLFLCTANSCRSQMAEGLARALKGDVVQAHSAGTRPGSVHPLARRALAEIGIDIGSHRSKSIDEVPMPVDYVVTVCDAAHELCPVLPGARIVHRGFEDPPRLAAAARDDDEAMPHFRRVRDQIRAFVEALPASLDDRSWAGTKKPGKE